jgi:hypothetical protein
MPNNPRLINKKTSLRLSSIIHFLSGTTVYGHTREIDHEGVTIELSAVPNENQLIGVGDAGLLSLRYLKQGIEEYMRMRCQVTHCSANGMGVSIRFYELNKREQIILNKIILGDRYNSLI